METECSGSLLHTPRKRSSPYLLFNKWDQLSGAIVRGRDNLHLCGILYREHLEWKQDTPEGNMELGLPECVLRVHPTFLHVRAQRTCTDHTQNRHVTISRPATIAKPIRNAS